MELKINLGINSYSIYIQKGIIEKLEKYIYKVVKGKKIVIITDDKVASLYGEIIKKQLKQYETYFIVIDQGEKSKHINILPNIYTQLTNFKLTRSDLIIALGGGVVGDLAGFVAATYLRGIQFIQIPTSLLAQVDSSVGGKVAVDLDAGKNLVGAFYHPKMVLIDPNVLKTLDQRFINDGMAEVIKYGLIKSPQLFQQLCAYTSFEDLYQDIEDIIYQCVNIKRVLVENDEKDFGQRLLLNFGHTLGHTIEQYFNYESYSHGEGVAIGMYQITLLSESLGLTEKGTNEKIKKILSLYNLPLECHVEMKKLLPAINLDKKNINNHLSLVLLKDIGQSFVYPTTLNVFDFLERI